MVYNILFTIGIKNCFQLFQLCIGLQIIALYLLVLSQLHLMYFHEILEWLLVNELYVFAFVKNIIFNSLCFIRSISSQFYLSIFDSFSLRLNYQIGILVGLNSISWLAHLIHISIPSSRGYRY